MATAAAETLTLPDDPIEQLLVKMIRRSPCLPAVGRSRSATFRVGVLNS